GDGEEDEDGNQQHEHDGIPARRRPEAAGDVPESRPAALRLRRRRHWWPPAKCAIIGSGASSPAGDAAPPPRNTTAIPSLSVSSSGISEEETRIPIPVRAASKSRR